MSLLRHLRTCNAYRPERFLPFLHGGVRLGFIRKDNAEALRAFPSFAVTDESVRFLPQGSFDDLSAIIEEVTEKLVTEGLVAKWRHEFFAAAPRWNAPKHFKIDRGAVPFFGVKAFGAHLNGFRHDGDVLKIWVGKRAMNKAVAPGKLDNLVAGGIDHLHGLQETLIKECGEEASLPESLARKAGPVGAVAYRMEVEYGMRDDVLFCYDLETPPDFEPKINDGELTGFMLKSAADLVEGMRTRDDFKFNVNLVLIDFALRHGLITPDDPEYFELISGLHPALD
jgi:isopentenyldiphosphate isomerase